MKITGLEIDGYGVWSGLRLEGLSEGMNVFFGPNEAGKTTLLQFVRSVLYGFTPDRLRYLPPLDGGRPGGSVHVAGPNGRFRVSRHRNQDGPGGEDEVCLEAPDGTRQGGHLVKVLLCNVDEAIFNNVFALGLDELHELAALHGTEAASLLYSLSVGLDRVALVDVLRELHGSRNRLLSTDGQPCQITQLVAERQKLREEIDQLDELTHRYVRLTAERQQLERETTRLEEEANQLRHQARVIEIAVSIGDRWQRRRELDDQLRSLGPAESIPVGAADELAAVSAALQRGADRMGRLRGAWDQLRAQAAELKVNEALWRLCPRIEALAEQEPWIGTLESRSAELETEITDLEAQLAAEQERLGFGREIDVGAMQAVSPRTLQVLRGPARELHRCRQRGAETEQEIEAARQTAESLSAQIEAAVVEQDEEDLAQAMDRAGGLVAQLRRRAQLDERIDQMEVHQADLEEQSRKLLERQVLPAGVLIGLGAVFVVSVMMVLAGLAGVFISESIAGSLAWPLALLGLTGLGAAVATKFVIERSNVRRLEGCHRQVRMLQRRTAEAKQEREALDRQLAIGDGSVSARLDAAEEKLAQLEELVPLDARRKAAQQEAEAASARARQQQADLDAARRRWREALHAVGLPTKLSPKQVRELASRSSQVADLRRRLESRYEEYEARRRELETLTARIAQLASDADVGLQAEDPIQQLRALAEHASQQEARLKRRGELRAKARRLRRKRTKCQRALRRLKYRQQEILRRAGVKDEHEFRRRAAELARVESVRRERESLQREIEAAIAGHCPEQAIAERLEGDRAREIEARHEQLQKRLHATEAKLQERFERRGQVGHELKALAEDRRPAAKQIELGMVEKRLEAAIQRWRVLAVTGRILESIRASYERERQPETLKEASAYLNRLTRGRYVRVWTPLDADVLLVDDAEGKPLPVDVLSRGVREQLFLAIRLALAATFARRGALLPLVLDDVLVNFDSQRAKAAAAVLRDFAEAGHQVLVFTCHEHIVKLFQALHVSVNELPDRSGLGLSAPASRKPAKRRRKSRPAPKPKELPEERPHESPHELVAHSAIRVRPEPEEGAHEPEEVHDDPAEEPAELISMSEVSGEEVEPVGPSDDSEEQNAPWEQEETNEPEDVSAEDEEAEEGGEEERDDVPRDTAYRGYYDDQGSYDDYGVEIANHFSRDLDREDDNDDYEEGDYDDRNEAEAA